MRKIKFVLVSLLVAVNFSFGWATTSDNVNLSKLFSEAYAKKDYSQAVELYQALVDEGIQSAEVFYNLGNAYFKQNELGPALLYYHKAYKLNPSDADIAFNIQFAEKQTIDKMETPTEFFLSKWWKNSFLTFSLSIWRTLLMLSLFLALAGGVLYLFSNQLKGKKVGFYSGISFLTLALLMYVLGNAQNKYFNTASSGIIFSASSTVKSAPEGGEKLFILHEGTKVEILEKHGEAINIQLPNGKSGWISSEEIREI